jgi:hypothetical protein
VTGCWKSVLVEKIPGTYVAAYPFGRETLVLNSDGSFSQKVEIPGEPPVTSSGTWTFDTKDSRIKFKGLVFVVDGFGHLKRDWRTSQPDFASLPAEILWFKITINSGAEYPYVKQ